MDGRRREQKLQATNNSLDVRVIKNWRWKNLKKLIVGTEPGGGGPDSRGYPLMFRKKKKGWQGQNWDSD